MELNEIPESFNQHLVRFDTPSGNSVMLRRAIPRGLGRRLRRPLWASDCYDEDGNLRPNLTMEQRDTLEQNGNELLAAWIVSWSYTGRDGQVLPVTAENMDYIGDSDYGPINMKIGELRQGRSEPEERAFPATDVSGEAGDGSLLAGDLDPVVSPDGLVAAYRPDA